MVCDCPAQIVTVADELVFAFTMSVVVIVESQPSAFGMTDVYVPAVK